MRKCKSHEFYFQLECLVDFPEYFKVCEIFKIIEKKVLKKIQEKYYEKFRKFWKAFKKIRENQYFI